MAATVAAVLCSCSGDIAYSDTAGIGRDGWAADRIVSFDAQVKPGVYDIDLLVRSTEKYEYQNIWLFVDTKIDGVTVKTDTVEGFLSDNFGRRLGQGIGSKLTDYVALADSVSMTDSAYTFSIRHGMRVDTLHGITDIGITISERK